LGYRNEHRLGYSKPTMLLGVQKRTPIGVLNTDNATWGTETNTDWGIQNPQCYLGYRNEHRLGYSKSTMLLGVQKRTPIGVFKTHNATWGTETNTDWGIQNRQCYLGYRNEHRLGYLKSTMVLGVQKRTPIGVFKTHNATWGTETNTDWGIQNPQCYLGYRNEQRSGYSKPTSDPKWSAHSF